MCTVTIIPLSTRRQTGRQRRDALPLVCNRDELRSRPLALPPQVREYGSRAAILPIDPVSDGTWIAVNDAGLAITLLNVHFGHESVAPRSAQRSRGVIILSLLSSSNLAEAIQSAKHIEAIAFPPFRLVLLDASGVAEARSDGNTIQICGPELVTKPIMFTSSGLGDHLVQGPRKEVFDHLFDDTRAWSQSQDEFHAHFWPDRRHLSVFMSRAEARTVSRTTIDLAPNLITMRYQPEESDQPSSQGAVTLELPRSAA